MEYHGADAEQKAETMLQTESATCPASAQGDFESLPPERKEAILAAGIEAFGLRDYKDARTQDIARRAGISKGLLFFYFRNKREFYFHLVNCELPHRKDNRPGG